MGMVYEGNTHTRSLGKIWCKLGGQDGTKYSTYEVAGTSNKDLFDTGRNGEYLFEFGGAGHWKSSKHHT